MVHFFLHLAVVSVWRYYYETPCILALLATTYYVCVQNCHLFLLNLFTLVMLPLHRSPLTVSVANVLTMLCGQDTVANCKATLGIEPGTPRAIFIIITFFVKMGAIY
uniref:Uncharacterized protein n=1 Tax=Cacopsylla melanoneura TaxID=428564 RepID=A0A8D9FIU8_9HEMI